jgi:hypothetical protein
MNEFKCPRSVVKHIGWSLKKANAQPKPAKELTYPNARQTAKLIDEMIENNKGKLVTRGIKHWGLSGCAGIQSRIKFGVIGQESSPQSPTISYTRPLGVMEATYTTTHDNY